MFVDTFPASEHSRALLQLDTHVESFLSHLGRAGYAERTLRQKRSIVTPFAQWTRREQVAVKDLNESHLSIFLNQLSPEQRRHGTAILKAFLEYVRLKTALPAPPPSTDPSPAACLTRRYIDYLRNGRGLSERSVSVYSPFIRDFVAELMAMPASAPLAGLDPVTVQSYLLASIRGRSSEYSRLLATALRSFLRFLYLVGETTIDMSLSVPTVRKWCGAAVPALLSPEQVERILGAVDRSTPRGRRDFAVLLLLARLGLRAGEVVRLELGDIRWRTGEIVVRGKGRVLDRLPLLSDTGEALAVYLRKDRGSSASRQVFLRTIAPRVGLRGSAAVSHIVRDALARAGIQPKSRGAAHLFRHSLATRMIRHGATMAEISEVLRHRSQSTTEIYAKVDFEALREVARPWPVTGGVR